MVGWSALGFGIAALGLGAWVGVRGYLAYQELDAARASIDGLSESVLEDPASAPARLDALRERTAAAAALTSDPGWRLVELIPGAGPNLEAVRLTAGSVDTLVGDVLAPLAESALGLEAIGRPVEGRFDVEALRRMQAPLDAASEAMADAAGRFAEIDRGALLPPIRDAVAQLDEFVGPVEGVVSAAAGAVAVLPAILGADGPRDTLVLFANNAELRAGGGIPGAMAMVRTDAGAIDLVAQASSSDFPRYETPVLDLDPEIVAGYTDRPGRFIQNVTAVPYFDLSAQYAAEMWARQFGSRPQAVVSVDPFTLSYILEATGPVELATGELLTADNAVDVLLHDVYLRYEDTRMQDVFFADAAARVFDRVRSGGYDTVALVRALVRAAQEDRVRLWSSAPEEQSVFEAAGLAHTEAAVATDEARFGVYLNDGTGAKMDYFLESSYRLTSAVCAADGEVEQVQVALTFTNTAPSDAATVLPPYITGDGNYGVAPGSILTTAYVFAPPGYRPVATDLDGVPDEGIAHTMEAGLWRSSYSFDLAPGESSTVILDYAGDEPAAGIGAPLLTPTFHKDLTYELEGRCELPLE